MPYEKTGLPGEPFRRLYVAGNTLFELKVEGIWLPISEMVFLAPCGSFLPSLLHIAPALTLNPYLAKYPVFARTFNPFRLGLITIFRKVSSLTSFVG